MASIPHGIRRLSKLGYKNIKSLKERQYQYQLPPDTQGTHLSWAVTLAGVNCNSM